MRIMFLFFCFLRGVLTMTVFSTLKWRRCKCGAIDSKGMELGDALWPGGLPYGISGDLCAELSVVLIHCDTDSLTVLQRITFLKRVDITLMPELRASGIIN